MALLRRDALYGQTAYPRRLSGVDTVAGEIAMTYGFIATPMFPAEVRDVDLTEWAKGHGASLFPLHRRDGQWVSNKGMVLKHGIIYSSSEPAFGYKSAVLLNEELYDVTELVQALVVCPLYGEEVSHEREWESGGKDYPLVHNEGSLVGTSISIPQMTHATVMSSISLYRLESGEILRGYGGTCGRGRRWSNHRITRDSDREVIATLLALCGR